MTASGQASCLVSVIIPVYNCEDFLRRCLDSVFDQTMRDFEVIAVNDGSTDRSLAILREYEVLHPNLRVLDQANAGQGAARNRAIDLARGEYILFVDSDDFIERVTLQVTTERAEEDQSDMVHFDWKMINDDPREQREFNYHHVEPFWHHRDLFGADCELLFRMHSYFSVTNLYRRSFLVRHALRYEEGCIYEDNPFLARVFTLAEHVSMVHSPLYAVQTNPLSSTKRDVDTDRHMRDHLSAMRKSFASLEPRKPETANVLAQYHFEKFSAYYARRVPVGLRAEYARETMLLLTSAGLHAPYRGRNTSSLLRVASRLGALYADSSTRLESLLKLKRRLTPLAKRAVAGAKKTKRRLRHPLRSWVQLGMNRRPAVLDPTIILFLGFDGRYTGNSRALFEELKSSEEAKGADLRYVTDDLAVPREQRIKPDSLELMKVASLAGTVIAETWIPASLPKHPDSTWIQLWHGTPIKRMLFDSHEPYITSKRPRHKVNKYRDIQRWDRFVVDGDVAADRFSTAFLLKPEQFIVTEYPRVKRLRQRLNTTGERERVLRKLGLERFTDKKVAVYAPTWRDYNYGKSCNETDLSYLIDACKRLNVLGADWSILYHDHDYMPVQVLDWQSRIYDVSMADIEDLMLISDLIISDYSSILLDAAECGQETLVERADSSKYVTARGTYGPL
ncbi:bifunctional glycosyltransferase/CDP-glycerol:glycerophosphate glycerophosphotransferase [Leucobacter sp. HY1908]